MTLRPGAAAAKLASAAWELIIWEKLETELSAPAYSVSELAFAAHVNAVSATMTPARGNIFRIIVILR
jgi:hypothetical protein